MLSTIIIGTLNIIGGLLLAPILDGIRRKLVARFQNRIGPPLLQTLYDLKKLFRKETLVPKNASPLFVLLPALAFVLNLSILLVIPTFIQLTPINSNIVLLLHLLIFSAFLIAISGSVSNNPYGIVGGSREIVLVSILEPALIITLIIFAIESENYMIPGIVLNHTITPVTLMAMIVYLFIMIAESSRIPFDISEAESEVSGGPTIEYSGKLLAFLKYSQLIRTFIIFTIFANIVFPYPNLPVTLEGFVISSTIYILKLIMCTLIVSIAESLNARFRLFEAIKYALFIFVLACLSLIFVFIPF